MANLPSFQSYGEYSSSNYGTHCLAFYMPDITIWFSYKTPVAFAKDGRRYVRKNTWGPTTGKHLNWIDAGDKDSRIDGQEFERLLAEAVKD